jgi:hypothetical protein
MGLVFARAAIAKILDRRALPRTLRSLGLRRGAGAIGSGVTLVEGALALALISGRAPVAAGLATAAFAVGLAGASLYASRLHFEIPCACFGSGDRQLGSGTLGLAVTLFLASGAAATVATRTDFPPSSVAEIAATAAVALVVIAGVKLASGTVDVARVTQQRRRLAQDLHEVARQTSPAVRFR